MKNFKALLGQLFVLVACLCAAGQAQGADMAEYRVIGYSADGAHFAFEQYGIQDGSGFAYADVFILDLERDRWLAGTPVRVAAQSEQTRLDHVRADALEQAFSAHSGLRFDSAHRVLAATTPMQQGIAEESLGFFPRPILTPIDPLHTLTLNVLPMDSPRDCFGMVETAGYELLLTVDSQGTQVLHRDSRLPLSRQCPASYGLAAVITPFDGQEGRAVALISVYQLGFEGLDRRFLAVPFDLSL